MNSRKVLIWAAVLIAVFLAGFIPQWVRANRLSSRVEALSEAQVRGELRSLAGRVFLETSMKNYGNALNYASRFFDRARNVMQSTESADLRQALKEMTARRDDITAGLARGDSAVYGPVQDLFRMSLERIP